MSDAEALKIIVDRRGKMYDPLVVDAFLVLYPGLRSGETDLENVVPEAEDRLRPEALRVQA
jgi:HD-GYP domain-containing protein (c-di-GMP phosphodiesterase class II)